MGDRMAPEAWLPTQGWPIAPAKAEAIGTERARPTTGNTCNAVVPWRGARLALLAPALAQVRVVVADHGLLPLEVDQVRRPCRGGRLDVLDGEGGKALVILGEPAPAADVGAPAHVLDDVLHEGARLPVGIVGVDGARARELRQPQRLLRPAVHSQHVVGPLALPRLDLVHDLLRGVAVGMELQHVDDVPAVLLAALELDDRVPEAPQPAGAPRHVVLRRLRRGVAAGVLPRASDIPGLGVRDGRGEDLPAGIRGFV
mmetsp:Transcript_92136/g.257533  ORF Transcript_92136/g.257533 Transcript_92136/m.257533 type:complete len:257 (+) Transcript_92136:479-1249(+)